MKIVILALAALGIYLLITDSNNSMELCQKNHSYSTCVYSLQR